MFLYTNRRKIKFLVSCILNVLAVRITMLCQNIYNYCTIAISVNEQCSYVALLHELIVYMNQIKSALFIYHISKKI